MKLLLFLALLLAPFISAVAQGGKNFQPRVVMTNSLATGLSILPLELVTDPAAAAYSTSRKLTNGWTGALGTVLRMSDLGTNSLTGTGTGNNISDLITWGGANCWIMVTNLWDQTGHGRHLLTGTTNGGFWIVTNGVEVTKNGHTVMKRVGVSSCLSATVTIALPVSFVAVVYSDSKVTSDILWTGNSTTRTAVKQGATTYRLNSSANLDTETLTLDQWDILRVKFLPTATGPDSIAVDGGSVSTGEAGDNGMTAIQIGNPTICADMMMGSFMMWSSDTDSGELNVAKDNENAFMAIY